MPPDRTDRLDALQRQLAPRDVASRIQWLFDDHLPDLPDQDGADLKGGEYLEIVAERRSRAVADLIAADGFDGVRGLALASKYPAFVGAAVADAGADDVGRMLVEFIDADASQLVDAAYAWVSRKGAEDSAWVASMASEFAGRPVAQARILQVSPDLESAWALAGRDAAVESTYWAEFSPYGRGQDFELAGEAARHLLEHDRPRAALALMNLYGRNGGVDPVLVVEGLEALVRQPEDHPDKFHIDGHEIERLLDLAREADVPSQRLGQLEWALRPALGYGAHSPILERQLAEDPAFFVEVLSMVFKARNDDSHLDLPEHVARNAYQLLDDWNVIPGTDVAGSIDPRTLDAWVDRAIELADRADRLGIALDQIGKVLAKAPGDADGSWPTRSVRSVIERVARSELDDGFRVQILNSRGVQSRGIAEGGDREREQAARYLALAELVADEAPRTAAALRSVAGSYEADARHFDEQALRINEGLDL